MDVEYEHFIGFQGVPADEDTLSFISKNCPRDRPTTIIEFVENLGAGEGNNRMIPYLKGDIIAKLDDDAMIVSQEYGSHIQEVMDLNPNTIISPYPVGLINNPGGVPKAGTHKTIYSEKKDTWYTLRPVNHIGGFGRIVPAHVVKQYTWPNDLSKTTSGMEDVNFSYWATQNKYQMYYLENALIIEHQESTLGQQQRYKTYYQNRK